MARRRRVPSRNAAEPGCGAAHRDRRRRRLRRRSPLGLSGERPGAERQRARATPGLLRFTTPPRGPDRWSPRCAGSRSTTAATPRVGARSPAFPDRRRRRTLPALMAVPTCSPVGADAWLKGCYAPTYPSASSVATAGPSMSWSTSTNGLPTIGANIRPTTRADTPTATTFGT